MSLQHVKATGLLTLVLQEEEDTPHTHHVSHRLLSQPSSLTLLTFKTSEANYPLCAHYWLVGKVSSTGFLTRNWKPVTEHWHSIWLPMELWVSQDKMHTTTKGGNRRKNQFPFEEIWLEELFRQNLSAETAMLFVLNLYGFQLERNLHFMFRT